MFLLVAGAATTDAAPLSRSTVPNPSATTNDLNAVACVSTSNCWAGGYFDSPTGGRVNQALQWDGMNWNLVATPNPGGAVANDNNGLNAVACISASKCWAVGVFKNKAGASQNEVLRWKRKWSSVKVPNPAGTAAHDANGLYGVACASSSNCWAVGEFTKKGKATLNEALHWGGKEWSQFSTPNPGGTAAHEGNHLRAVACVASSDCWAVGYAINKAGALVNETLHWNGKKWSSVKVPNPGGTGASERNLLDAIACASRSECWAAGFFYNGTATLNEVFRWNGTKWAAASTPNPSGTTAGDDNEIDGVACISASDCWAMGFYFDSVAGAYKNEALQWDGMNWSLIATPNPGGTATNDFNGIYGVSCIPASDCWAVGQIETGSGPLLNEALLWDGMKWTAQ
jgi:hypothetical protein